MSELTKINPDDPKGWVIRSEVNRLQRDMVTFKPHGIEAAVQAIRSYTEEAGAEP